MSSEEDKGHRGHRDPDRYRKRSSKKSATSPNGDLGYSDYIKPVSIAADTCAMTACSLALAWQRGRLRANDHKHTQVISCQKSVCKQHCDIN